ncbi:MAG: hypothetical protein ACTSRA_05235 [Promethearchaeota archaeon]
MNAKNNHDTGKRSSLTGNNVPTPAGNNGKYMIKSILLSTIQLILVTFGLALFNNSAIFITNNLNVLQDYLMLLFLFLISLFFGFFLTCTRIERYIDPVILGGICFIATHFIEKSFIQVAYLKTGCLVFFITIIDTKKRLIRTMHDPMLPNEPWFLLALALGCFYPYMLRGTMDSSTHEFIMVLILISSLLLYTFTWYFKRQPFSNNILNFSESVRASLLKFKHYLRVPLLAILVVGAWFFAYDPLFLVNLDVLGILKYIPGFLGRWLMFLGFILSIITNSFLVWLFDKFMKRRPLRAIIKLITATLLFVTFFLTLFYKDMVGIEIQTSLYLVILVSFLIPAPINFLLLIFGKATRHSRNNEKNDS